MKNLSTKTLFWAGCCAVLIASTAAMAGESDAGKEKSKVCAACHGPDGNSQSPDFPRLAGQHEDYLVRALKDYQSGARKNPIMAPQAAKLSQRDIADLAGYFSHQQGLVDKR
jgi:cytochrome c553